MGTIYFLMDSDFGVKNNFSVYGDIWELIFYVDIPINDLE
jgi:hypothetical protein